MVKNPKFLKNLLTTASAVALIGGFSTSAMAAVRTSNNVAATARDGVGALTNFDVLDFTTGADTLKYGADATTITINGPLNHSAGIVNVDGKNGAILDVKNVFNYGDGAGNFRNLTDIELRVTDAAANIQIQNLVGGNNATVSNGVFKAHTVGQDLVVSGGTVTLTGNVTRHILSTGGVTRVTGTAVNVSNTVGDVKVDGNVAGTVGNTTGTVVIGGTVGGLTTLNGAGTTKITGNIAGLNVRGVHTTELGGNVGATALVTDETITLKGDVDRTVRAVAITPVIGGTFIADEALAGKTLVFTANVGAVGNSLKLLQVKGGSGIQFDGDAFVKKIDVGTQDVVISLADDYKIEELVHENNKVTLSVAANTTLLAGTVVSDETHRLKGVVLNGAKTLTIADQVNIYAINTGAAVSTGIYTTVANAGDIVFEGDSTLDAVMPIKINTITLNDVAKTVKIVQAVQTHGAITVGGNAGGVMQFGDTVNAAALQSGAVDKGTAEFINKKDANITLAGAGAGLLAVKISGGNLTFTDKFVKATTYAFGNQAANILVSSNGAVDLAGKAITTESTTGNQNFTIANGALTLGAVGADGKLFGTFSTNTAGNLITITNAAFFASVGGKDVNVTFNAADGRVQNIGSSDKPMDTASFTENTKVFGNAYAKVMDITDAKTTTFNGIVDGGNVAFKGVAAKAVFNDGSKLISTLIPTVDHHGIAQFDGATTIVNGLGKSGNSIAEANFTDTAGKTQSLGGDFYADSVSFLKTIAQATNKKVTFYGEVEATDTTFDLGTAGITLANGADSAIKGDTVLKTTFNGTTNGLLTVDGAATKATLTDLKSLTVVLKDATTGRRKSADPIRFISATGGAGDANFVNLGKVTPSGKMDDTGNKNVNWEFDENTLTFVFNDVSDTRAKEAVAANGGTIQAQANIDKIYSAVVGTDAFALADEWSVLTTIDPKAEADASNRISSPVARTVSSAVNTALGQLGSVVTGRMQTLANPTAIRVTQADGVSAGAEDTLRYGAWGSPFYSQGVQKMRKGVSGYKSKTVGGTVGFDTMANDTMIVGIAATIAKTDLKHKDINAGDKTKADTLMFSIYGLQEINDDWFLQGVANFGSTKVKNTSKRIGSQNNAVTAETATGKYDSMSWGGELLGGYNMNITSMAVITPMLGLDYTRTNDGGFTETGTRNQNLSVSKKSVDKTQLVAGVRAVMADIEQSGFVVTPEVHGFVRQALGSKNPKLTVKLDGAGELDTSNNAKLARTTGNLGLGINASSGMMSYGLTYDAHMANKYVGHQGTFKVRVNF